MHSFRPTGSPGHDLDALRAELTELEGRLGDRSAEVLRTKADYDAFRIRYRQEVGLLHEELDRLELDLAEAELGILKERLADAAGDLRPTPPPSVPSRNRDLPPTRFANCSAMWRRRSIRTWPAIRTHAIAGTR